jgi:hypothetical protein
MTRHFPRLSLATIAAAMLGASLPVTCAWAACLPTETLVGTTCQSRVINHFTIGPLQMTGVPSPDGSLPPLPPPMFDVGTLAMTGIGRPHLFDVGTLQMTGIAKAAP